MAARVFLDRIEEGIAILQEDGDGSREREVSACDLPSGVREGDWLTVRRDGDREVYEIDPVATADAKAKTQALMDDLLDS